MVAGTRSDFAARLEPYIVAYESGDNLSFNEIFISGGFYFQKMSKNLRFLVVQQMADAVCAMLC